MLGAANQCETSGQKDNRVTNKHQGMSSRRRECYTIHSELGSALFGMGKWDEGYNRQLRCGGEECNYAMSGHRATDPVHCAQATTLRAPNAISAL